MNFSILLIYTLTSTTEPFNASKAFLALSVINVLRFPLTLIPFVITGVIQVSIIKRRLIMMPLVCFVWLWNSFGGSFLNSRKRLLLQHTRYRSFEVHAICSVFILTVSANRYITSERR